MSDHSYYMNLAILEAKKAEEIDEVPVGAIIIRNDEIIATAFNLREKNKNALAHAELLAIDKACKKLGAWRLSDCTLYVTLEPCPMCMGGIINSRIKTVVFGAYDKKAGSCGTVVNLAEYPYNHKPEIMPGILADECGLLLTNFFRKLR